MPHRKRAKKRPVCKFPRTAKGKFKKWTSAIKKKNRNCRLNKKWKAAGKKTRRVGKKQVRKYLKAKRRVSKPSLKTYTRSACRTAAQKTIAVIRNKDYSSVAAVKRDVTRMLGKNSKFAMRGRERKKSSKKKARKLPRYGPLRSGYRFPIARKVGPLRSGYRFPRAQSLAAARGMPGLVPIEEDYSGMPTLTPLNTEPVGSVIQSGYTPQELRMAARYPYVPIKQSGLTPQQLRAEARARQRRLRPERNEQRLADQIGDFFRSFTNAPGDEPLYVSPVKPKRPGLRSGGPVLESTTMASSTY